MTSANFDNNLRGSRTERGLLAHVTAMLDLRAAFRALRRSPAFTVGAILTLAVALGLVATAVGLLAGALTGDTAGRDRVVVYLTEKDDGRAFRMRWPYPAVEVLQESAQSFERLATYTAARLNADPGSEAIRIEAEFVSPDYFDIVGIAPAIGRLPSRVAPRSAAAPREAVISDGAWQRLYGGSPAVIGREIRITRQPIAIVGVMPRGFRGLSARADVWLPHTLAPDLSFREYFTSTEYFQTVIAQLKPDVTIDRSRSELAVIAPRIASAVPPRGDRATDRGVDVVAFDEARRSASTVRARSLAAIGSVLVLLIAAVNIATLVAARVAGRQREYAIRIAVGAGRARVFRAISFEIGLVMAAGFGAAIIAALWMRDLIASVLPQALAAPSNDYGQLASFAGMRIDPVVMAVVAVLAIAVTTIITIPGCRRVLNEDLGELLKRAGAGRAPGVSLRALLAVQIAASIALLASAGLVFRTIWALGGVDPGFNPTGVLAFSVNEDLAVQRPDSGPALVERLLDVVKSAPGVASVTVDQSTPFSPRGARLSFVIEGHRDAIGQPPAVGWHRVGPDHFATLGIPVLRGRGFTASDRRGRQPVVAINEEAARRFFPDRDPLGQRVRLPAVVPGDAEVAEIVGVVGNVIYWPPDEPPGPDVYQPALQFSYPFTTLMVRAAGDPAPVIAAVRNAVRQTDPDLPLFDIVSLADLARAGAADRRFLLILLATCAALGLLLSAIGVFAMTASWLEARRRELGVRVALGAHPTGLVRLVMRGTMSQAALGTIAGLVIAFAAGRALDASLFGVGPHDPLTLAGASVAMLSISAVAAYLPARRALRLDPVREINAE
jgi:putative ABC transport system permease protein